MRLRLLIRSLHTHPEFPLRADALAVSRNDRDAETNLLLRAILVRLGGDPEAVGATGQDIAPLSHAWEADLWTLARQASPGADVWDALAELEGQ